MKTEAEYQQLAKELRQAFHEGDPIAKARVARVWGRDPALFFGLVRAQHVIAKEEGFDAWGALLGSLPVPPAPKVPKPYKAPRPPCPHFDGPESAEFCPLCARGETVNLVTGKRAPATSEKEKP